ncbi:MAG: 30S ribosomal protein S2, partial [Pseudolysinimonas sp.]
LQYPIPGNDDAIRSVGLLTRIIADAAAEGLIQRHQSAPAEGNVSAVEPLAEWEAELLHASETPATPTEENDADAVVAEHEAAADATIVPEHAPESDAETEAKIEAEATDAEKKPVAKKAPAEKPAAKKPAAEKSAADKPAAEKPAAAKPAAKK